MKTLIKAGTSFAINLFLIKYSNNISVSIHKRQHSHTMLKRRKNIYFSSTTLRYASRLSLLFYYMLVCKNHISVMKLNESERGESNLQMLVSLAYSVKFVTKMSAYVFTALQVASGGT